MCRFFEPEFLHKWKAPKLILSYIRVLHTSLPTGTVHLSLTVSWRLAITLSVSLLMSLMYLPQFPACLLPCLVYTAERWMWLREIPIQTNGDCFLQSLWASTLDSMWESLGKTGRNNYSAHLLKMALDIIGREGTDHITSSRFDPALHSLSPHGICMLCKGSFY